jgi:hypothetical protein
MWRWICALPILASVAIVHAEQPVKWECSFTTASGYDGGDETEQQPEKYRVTPQKLAFSFLVTDKQAFMLGNLGASEVGVFRTDKGGIQFVERTASGVLQLTAIDSFGNAVHSRNTVGFDGALIASQSYGKCKKM